MKLIIAEKPAQARDYAEALGGFQRREGYLESKDSYITWCFGHLIQLEEDTVYRPSGYWNKSYLPLIPNSYQYCIGKAQNKKEDPTKKKQLKIIYDLAKKSSEIINATDADREGELIFLYVYNFLKLKLPYKRLWISSLTKGDILNGFRNLLTPEDVRNLGKAGYARAISDWLVGINGTQAATLQLGQGNLLTVGRVQTAILKIICERYLKNKNFTSVFTYRIKAEHQLGGIPFSSLTETYDDKKEAENILNSLKSSHAFKEKITQQKKVNPPLLFSIDTLIVEANKIFNYSGQETLAIAQSLYEKKLTTYPRTDSNYINEENFSSMKNYLQKLAEKVLDVNFSFGEHKPKSVNAQKLTGSHDAIVPTGETSAYSSLNEKEKKIYHLIIHKCLESFSTSAIYDKCKYVFINNGIEFFTKTSFLRVKGWKSFSYQSNNNEDDKSDDEIEIDLNLIPGQKIDVTNKSISEIASQPPKLYTDANLTPDLTNIGKFLKEENPELVEKLKSDIDLNNVQIGTQATRPAIIERLKKVGFITVEKKKYIPTEKGLQYYNTIKNLELSNIANTAILEKELKDISEGKLSDNLFYENLNQYVKSIVEDIFSIKNSSITHKESSGKCPKCKKGDIVSGKKGYGCNQYKNGCDFVIWKTVAGKNLTEKNIKDLIEKGATSTIKGFTGKKGKFDAALKLNNDFRTEFLFN